MEQYDSINNINIYSDSIKMKLALHHWTRLKNIAHVIFGLFILIFIFLTSYLYAFNHKILFFISLAFLLTFGVLYVYYLASKYSLNVAGVPLIAQIRESADRGQIFASRNDRLDRAVDLVRELLARSKEFVFILSGRYAQDLYAPLKKDFDAIKEKIGKENIKIIVRDQPKNMALLEGYNYIICPQLKNNENVPNDFIITDFGFRLEASHVNKKGDTEAYFYMHNDKSDKYIKQLKSEFEAIWTGCNGGTLGNGD